MLQFINQGWKTTRSQTFLILILFLYQWIWGIVLYRFIKSIVMPLLHRYPGEELSRTSVQLYLAEGQFQLIKTDLAYTYLWLLLGMGLIRMIITPLINAGVYFSLHRTDLNPGYRFIKGIKQLYKPYFFYYLLQTALTLAPLYWILPKTSSLLKTNHALTTAAVELIPYFGGLLIYGYLVHLIFMFMQLGRLTGTKWLKTGSVVIRHLLTIVILSLILFGFSGIVALIAYTSSMFWAGLTAIILHQLYYMVKTIFKIWGIAAQYHLWTAKIGM